MAQRPAPPTALRADERRVVLTFVPPRRDRTAWLILVPSGAVALVVGLAARQPDMVWFTAPLVALVAAGLLAAVLLDPAHRGPRSATFDLDERVVTLETPGPSGRPERRTVAFDEVAALAVTRLTSKGGQVEVMELRTRGGEAVPLAQEIAGGRLVGAHERRLRALADEIAERTGLPRDAAPDGLVPAVAAASGVARG